MRNTEKQMETWEIKMLHPMTLWGKINSRIEYLVARYGSMIDHATTNKDKAEIEKEFIITMHSYGVVCDFTGITR